MVHLKLYKRSLKKSAFIQLSSFAFLMFTGMIFYASVDSVVRTDRFADSTFSSWNKLKSGKREIASSSEFSCKEDRFSIQAIKRQINIIQSKLVKTHKMTGEWKGIKLQNLYPTEALYLSEYGKEVGQFNRQYNFSTCGDLPCIINKVYGDKSEKAGYISYYWFLKTGTILSSSNVIPNQKTERSGFYQKTEVAYNDYLFTQEQLKKFYVMALSLPEKFLHNPLLRSIHKVPNNYPIEGLAAKRSCMTSLPTGQIILTDRCMEKIKGKNGFFTNLTQQMASFIDQTVGKDIAKTSISNSHLWKDFSGWFSSEGFNTSNGDYYLKWNRDQSEGVSQTGMNPSQQFTKLASLYRYDPTTFSNTVSSGVKDFFASEVFSNQMYDPEGLYLNFTKESIQTWSHKESEVWTYCFSKNKDYVSELRGLATLSGDSRLFNCANEKATEFVSEQILSLKKNHYEGCNFFNKVSYDQYSKKFLQTLKNFIDERILIMKLDLAKFKEQVVMANKAKMSLLSNLDPTNIYLTCYKKDNAQKCFSNHIRTSLSNKLNATGVSIPYKNQLLSDISKLFSFYDIKDRAESLAKNFSIPYYSKLSSSANGLWNSCKNESTSRTDQLNNDLTFTGQHQYISAALLNCVNKNLNSLVHNIVTTPIQMKSGKEAITFNLNDKERVFVQKILKARMTQTMNNILKSDVKFEKKSLDKFFKKNNELIMSDVLKKKDFLKEVYSIVHVEKKCLALLTRYYPKKYYYHTTSELDKAYGRSICKNFLNDSEVQRKVKREIANKWQHHKEMKLDEFKEMFVSNVDDCNDAYPISQGKRNLRNSRMRRRCIEDSYEQVYGFVIDDWKESHFYNYFYDKESDLKRYLSRQRSDLVGRSIAGELE